MRFLTALAQARHLAEVNIAAEAALELLHRTRIVAVVLVIAFVGLIASAFYVQSRAIDANRADIAHLEAE